MRLREALVSHPIARRLSLSFDAQRLCAALEQQKEEWWTRHAGPYHDGGWESISIWAPNGNLFEQRSYGGSFAKTVAALVSPYFWDVAEHFDARKSRVRLMRLRPGARILRHCDPLEDIAPDLVRLHVPVRTHDEVRFLVDDHRIAMRPGEVWHVDVRFPHEVHNAGTQDRVHLVLDLVRSASLDALLEDAQAAGHGRLTSYYLKHLVPRRLRPLLGVDGNG
jgi:hypothetical protein